MEIDRNRPFIGFVLSLLGAAFTLVTEGAHVNYILKTSPDSFAANLPSISFALIFGILITACALLIYFNSSNHSLWGTFVIVLSIVSVFQGSNIINVVLCIVGGIMTIKWEPQRSEIDAEFSY